MKYGTKRLIVAFRHRKKLGKMNHWNRSEIATRTKHRGSPGSKKGYRNRIKRAYNTRPT